MVLFRDFKNISATYGSGKMKKYMLLNMLMIFGVMQTGDLFCMHKLIKLTKIVKPVNMSKFDKSKLATKPKFGKTFKRYNSTNFYQRILLGKFNRPRTVAVCFGIGFVSYYIGLLGFIALVQGVRFKKRDMSTENEIGEIEMNEWLRNLRYADKDRDIRILLNQPKLINYLNSNIRNGFDRTGFSWERSGFARELSGIISKSFNDNNQLKLVLMSGYLSMTERALKRFIATKDHEDPEMMAKLLIGWKNNNKLFESLCDNDGKIPDCSNKIGCKIFEEEIDRIRRARHNKYIESLKKRDMSTENEIGEREMKEWLRNLRYADKDCDIRILLNQPKLINYLNSNIRNGFDRTGFSWERSGFARELSGIISKSFNDNNQLKLVLMSGYLSMTERALKRFIATKDHEDPEMMAKLLIGWKNNNKLFESLYNNGKIPDCSNKITCEIFKKEIDRIRREKHDKYIKSLQNKSKN